MAAGWPSPMSGAFFQVGDGPRPGAVRSTENEKEGYGSCEPYPLSVVREDQPKMPGRVAVWVWRSSVIGMSSTPLTFSESPPVVPRL